MLTVLLLALARPAASTSHEICDELGWKDWLISGCAGMTGFNGCTKGKIDEFVTKSCWAGANMEKMCNRAR